MSLSANRFQLSCSRASLQGLTLEAAVQEALTCLCDSCRAREGQYVPNGYVSIDSETEEGIPLSESWVDTSYVCSGISPFRDRQLCETCAEWEELVRCRCGDWQIANNTSCQRCSRAFFCTCGAEVQEAGLCRACEQAAYKRLIRSYSYKPRPSFIGKGPLFLGVELEVLAGIDTAKALQKVASYRSYLKRDSSIRGEGFEIVTHPMSLAKQLDYWEEILQEVGEELTPHRSCGMHVHLSRQPLTQIQIGKLLVFLNNPENELWIDLLAGRPANHYCQKAEKTIEDALNPQSRYEALNLMNEQTIEFRLFASSNKLVEICGRIEFCHAVTAYCKDCSLESLDWDSFMEWLYVSSDKDTYLFLKEWIETTPEPEEKQVSDSDSYDADYDYCGEPQFDDGDYDGDVRF